MTKKKKRIAWILAFIAVTVLGVLCFDSVVFSFRLNKAIYYAENGQYELSIYEYDKLIESDTQVYELHFNKAVLFAKNGDSQSAIDAFKTASLINDQDPDLFYNLSLLYEPIDEDLSKIYLEKATYLEFERELEKNAQ